MMEKMKKDVPKLLRIYGKKVERRDFPLPDEPVSSKHTESTTEAISNSKLRKITLHWRIRQKTNPYHEEILQFDKDFKRKKPEKISVEEIDKYLSCVMEASKLEIRQAEILLCTCSTAAGFKITDVSNIQQLIIDECGMCTEPESMIPIVATKAPQVILIGDHKQLQPIIKCKHARHVGLNVSMFQRYAQRRAVQMLTIQYRMHEAIMAFPSKQFYNNRLECGLAELHRPSDIDIWPDRAKPIVFCHVEGYEKSLPVSSSEGGVESMSNDSEAKYVTRYARLLMETHHKSKEDICILSPYRSQCTGIRQQLEGNHVTPGVQVLTVVKSQGSEWDYVILSCVRSKTTTDPSLKPGKRWFTQNLGIVCDPHQINVAITRAKKGLIIVGNKKLLGHDPVWKKLIDHLEKDKGIVDADKFMDLRAKKT